MVWKYCRVLLATDHFEAEADILGGQGWELVAVGAEEVIQVPATKLAAGLAVQIFRSARAVPCYFKVESKRGPGRPRKPAMLAVSKTETDGEKNGGFVDSTSIQAEKTWVDSTSGVPPLVQRQAEQVSRGEDTEGAFIPSYSREV